jgi:hypothetical protein
VCILCISSQLSLYSNQGNLLILLFIICLLLGGGIIILLLFKDLKDSKINHLVIYDNGLIDYDFQVNLSLHINSRIGWFGCWLILIDHVKHDEAEPIKQTFNFINKKVVPVKIFIFKDSLSMQDYSRLTRKILSNHR